MRTMRLRFALAMVATATMASNYPAFAVDASSNSTVAAPTGASPPALTADAAAAGGNAPELQEIVVTGIRLRPRSR